MKTVSLAFLLAVGSGETFGQASPVPRVNMSRTAEISESIVPTSPHGAGIASAKEASIRKLLEIEGSNPCLDSALADLDTGALLPKNLAPDQKRLTQLALTRFKEKIRNDEIRVGVSVYDEHFSQAEIDRLASLYSTPLARKEISVRDQVLVEIHSRQTKLMRQWAEEATTEILNENPDLRKKVEADPNWDPKR